MSHKLTPAIEALQEELERQLSEVAETKRTINSLLRRMGQEPIYTDDMEEARTSTIRADQFYGKPLATAAREYLEIRRNRGAVDAAEILQGLQSGGFDFRTTGWKEKDYLRMLSISLAKNNVTFHRLPNGTFGLLAWYPQATTKKKAAISDEDSSSEESSSEDES